MLILIGALIMSSVSLVVPPNDERVVLPPVGFGLDNEDEGSADLSLKLDETGGCGMGDNDNLVFAGPEPNLPVLFWGIE